MFVISEGNEDCNTPFFLLLSQLVFSLPFSDICVCVYMCACVHEYMCICWCVCVPVYIMLTSDLIQLKKGCVYFRILNQNIVIEIKVNYLDHSLFINNDQKLPVSIRS